MDSSLPDGLAAYEHAKHHRQRREYDWAFRGRALVLGYIRRDYDHPGLAEPDRGRSRICPALQSDNRHARPTGGHQSAADPLTSGAGLLLPFDVGDWRKLRRPWCFLAKPLTTNSPLGSQRPPESAGAEAGTQTLLFPRSQCDPVYPAQSGQLRLIEDLLTSRQERRPVRPRPSWPPTASGRNQNARLSPRAAANTKPNHVGTAK